MSSPQHQSILFQEIKDVNKIPYAGDERREGVRRNQLSEDSQTLLEAIRGMVSCKDKCIIPKEFHPAIPKALSTLAEIGGGNYYVGAERIRDNYNESSDFFSWIRNTKALIWKIIVAMIVTAAIGLFGRALWNG